MIFSLKTQKYPFYLSIMMLTTMLVFMLTLLFFWISYTESSIAARKTADQLFSEVNQKMVGRYEHAMGSVASFTGTVALMPGIDKKIKGDGLSHPSLNLIIPALKYYEQIFSIYVGYGDGSFLQVISSKKNQSILSQYRAPKETHFIVRSILANDKGARHQHWRFLDADKHIIGSRDEAEVQYDPRKRPWFIQANQSDRVGFTVPYLFSYTKIPGITCSKELAGKKGVFGVDITLDRFTISLKNQKISENSLLFFFDHSGRLIAHSKEDIAKTSNIEINKGSEKLRFLKVREVDDPIFSALIAQTKEKDISFNQTNIVSIKDQNYFMRISKIDPNLGFQMMIGSVAPMSDFTQYIRRMQYQTAISSVILLFLIMPLVFRGGKKFSSSLIRLGKEADKIRNFDFSPSDSFDSIIKEIHSLIQAFDLMQITIYKRTNALIATQKKLRKLVQSGIALSAEQDVDKLMEMIFTSAKALSNTDGGVLLLRDKQNQLNVEIMQTTSEQILKARDISNPDLLSPLPLYDGNKENHNRLESHVALTGNTVIIDDNSQNSKFDLLAACLLDKETNQSCNVFLTVPLKPREEKAIGVLQLVNPRNKESGELSRFDKEVVGFVEALASQAAIALHNKNLLEAQRNLFNAFIQLIAGAIDAKSPYTG